MDTVSQKLEEVLHGLAFEKIKGGSPHRDSDPLLARLKALGTEVWIDTGELEKAQEIWKDELTALTTNNTLANQVVQSGIMDKVIEDTIREIRREAKVFRRRSIEAENQVVRRRRSKSRFSRLPHESLCKMMTLCYNCGTF